MLKKLLFTAILGSLVSINAHDFIITQNGANKFGIKFGHAPDYKDKFEKKQILDAFAFDNEGKIIKTGIEYNFDSNKSVEILTEKNPAVLVSSFSGGSYIKTDDKSFKNTNKTDVKGVIFSATKGAKINKRYFSWNKDLTKPLGLKLEIIALANPFKLQVGDFLPVLVLKDGKAKTNAVFFMGKDEPKVETNEFGIAYLPIKKKGYQQFGTFDREQIFEENASVLNLSSSISFELK